MNTIAIDESVPKEGNKRYMARTTPGDPKENEGRCDGTGGLATVRRVSVLRGDHFVYFEGADPAFHWKSVSQKKLQEIYGNKKADVRPIEVGEKMYLLETDSNLNPTAKILYLPLYLVVMTSSREKDWRLSFKGIQGERRWKVLSSQQSELEEKFQQQLLEDEVQTAVSTSEASRTSTASA